MIDGSSLSLVRNKPRFLVGAAVYFFFVVMRTTKAKPHFLVDRDAFSLYNKKRKRQPQVIDGSSLGLRK